MRTTRLISYPFIMKKPLKRITRHAKKTLAVFVILWLSVLSPVSVFAQEAVDANGNPTGAPADTGAPTCTGAGCGQGSGQGANQGTNQGGQSAEDLGADENGNLPEGTEDNRQGANQGAAAGTSNGTTASNTNTGADSNNQNDATTNNSTSTGISNTANDTTNANATGTTGNNTNSANTGDAGITSGNAGIGVTQVKNDNTATIGGTAGLNVTGHQGDYVGDLNLGFSAGTADLSSGSSVRATNDTTGANSNNGIDITTRSEEINEIQNDGRIDNFLDLAAITGQNQANKNTGDGAITTGDANVAATLVNLLNTSVINGDLWIAVANIFGDLQGNINVPDLASFLSSYAAASRLAVDASNDTTGSDSDNTIEVDITDHETTTVDNNADINTTVNANAITGQNEATANTGGSEITTGDANVSASNVTLANTTIEGGNWGLFIVNALNGWLGFLVGDNGDVRALSQDETLREIEARNSNTGADSDNHISVTDESERTTDVQNDAVINNQINASAITGQNEANKNTGQGSIATGDANVQATTVNIANTTVKDGSLFIAVVNIFGDWFGDLLYGGSSLAAAAASQAGTTVDINAENTHTGSDSTNTIDVDYDRTHETTVHNDADIRTTLNANVDTGSNKANKNTLGANIKTGDGLLALHSRTAANLTGIAGNNGVAVQVTGLNDTTGNDSLNRIRANINNERVITINNDANVSTVIGERTPATVNTGNNEANQNTLGATIATGSITAEVAIQNLVNQVIVALIGQGVTVDADFTNQLTGFLSNNLNELDVTNNALVDVLNRGVVANIIDLLLNTGGNKANENTGGGDIATGEICVDVAFDTQLNKFGGNLGGASLDLTQDGTADNDVDVQATTGNNETKRNTGTVGNAGEPGTCAKLAVAPSPSPTPTPPGGEDEHDEEHGAGGGGDEDQGGDDEGRVAGVSKKQPKKIVTSLLKRFPVAGGESMAELLQGKRQLPWQLFLVVSLVLVGAAWQLDAKGRRNEFGSQVV